MISRTIRFRIYRDQTADTGDYRLGLAVVLVGIRLVLRANSLADYDCDLVVVRGMHTNCTPSIYDLQASSGGEILLKMVVEEAKEIASTPKEKRDLGIFRERAATAYIASNPVGDGAEASKEMHQFIRENLE